MYGARANPVRLYAAIPVEDGSVFRMRGVRIVRTCAIAAIVGVSPCADDTRAAVRHDRIVARALERCSAVVPFRFGVAAKSEQEVMILVDLNSEWLLSQLRRFQGRVEMGLKARVASWVPGEPLRVPFGIGRIRALAPRSGDRMEGISRTQHGTTLEGCYLISKRDIEAYWSALDRVRRAAPEVSLLGTGPWAPYSFCDTPLQRSDPLAQAPLSTV